MPIRLAVAGAVAALLLAGCDPLEQTSGGLGGNDPPPTTAPTYHAVVTRTAFGVPHITAADHGSLGYGLGYAFAEDNLCVMMDDIITNRGERAKYFGRAGSYTIAVHGTTAKNVDSDFFWKLMADDAAVARLKAASLPAVVAATRGYKDGFNRYIAELGAGDHPGRYAACRDGAWLAPISEDDMYRRYMRLALIASSSVFINGIASARPPALLPGGAAATPAPLAASEPTVDEMVAALRADPGPLRFFLGERSFGSNMYALGPEATANGMPIVFGNPHFPWSGTERLYVFHATIPGAVNVMGSALYGVPAVNIGFTDHFAWSHTVSTAYRFSVVELTLVPGAPTRYLYDGQILQMEAVPLAIEVTEADGSATTEARTLYRSKYGPMVGFSVSGIDILPWTPLKAFALRDANHENDRMLNQFFGWNRAQSLAEFKALHRSVLGIPWVNTVAAGPGQPVYYGDVSVVPHVTDQKALLCGTSAQALAVGLLLPGLPVLDGSRADCEWGSDPDAPVPGIFGPGNLPKLERSDWVHNCNDSHWLTNPAAPLAGYPRIIGPERTARSLRTRLCMKQVQRRLAGSDGRPGNTFDLASLQDTVLDSHLYSAQLARQAVLGTVCPLGVVLSSSGLVSISKACAVLAAWDGKANHASVGAHLWREFFRHLAQSPLGLPVGLPIDLGPWLTPFSPYDPVNTPRNLNVLSPLVHKALGDAVKRLADASVPLDAPLGTLQRSGVIGDAFIPVFGGEGFEGAFTVASSPAGLTADGYQVTSGNSYLQTVTWAPDGAGYTPIADGFLTYSQSTDPASPHFHDFTAAYSAKDWHRFPFRAADVEAQKIRQYTLAE